MGLFNIFKKQNVEVKESGSLNYSLTGEPYPFDALWNYNYFGGYIPVIMRDPWSWKASTLRTIQDVDRVRSMGRWLSETNPWAQSLLRGLTAFTINKGFGIKVIAEEGDNKRLVKQVQKILDDFAEDNELDDWFKEKYYRDIRDGECFIRLFNDDIPQIRAIEPDMVRPPTGENTEGHWSMGIKHPEFDYQKAEAYCCKYFDNSEEIISASQVYHSKSNVVKNVKRGVTAFYPCFEILQSTTKLLWAWEEGAKVREAIAYGMETTADKTTIQNLVDSNVSNTFTRYNPDGSSRDVKVEQIEPGMVPRLPKGYHWIDPPQSGTAAAEAIEQGLRAVAARFNAPPFLLGIGSDSSYASAVLPESLFLRTCEHQQNKQAKFWHKVLKGVIQLKIDSGELPLNTLEAVCITLIPPSPISRNRDESVKVDLELVKNKLMSQHTFCSKYDLDFEEEQDTIQSEPEIQIQQVNTNNNGQDTMNGELQHNLGKP